MMIILVGLEIQLSSGLVDLVPRCNAAQEKEDASYALHQTLFYLVIEV